MPNFGYHKGICEVHKYALRDTTLRDVFYCSICDANICESCNNNYALRFMAMSLRAAERLRNKIQAVRR